MAVIEIRAPIKVAAKQFIDNLDIQDLGDFCSDIAEKFDQEFDKRAWTAAMFSEGLSEQGCRFLAEAIAAHYARLKPKELENKL